MSEASIEYKSPKNVCPWCLYAIRGLRDIYTANSVAEHKVATICLKCNKVWKFSKRAELVFGGDS